MPARSEHRRVSKRLEMQRTDWKVTFVLRWRTVWSYVMIPFTLYWSVTSVVITTDDDLPAFGGLFVLSAIVVAYINLGALFNRTRVTVGDGSLEVRARPFPWSSDRVINAADIEQPFVMLAKDKHGQSVTRLAGRRRFEFWVTLKNGAWRKLVAGLTYDEAEAFERAVEDELGIAPKRVPGEARRP